MQNKATLKQKQSKAIHSMPCLHTGECVFCRMHSTAFSTQQGHYLLEDLRVFVYFLLRAHTLHERVLTLSLPRPHEKQEAEKTTELHHIGSLVQPRALGHMHEVVHAARHLPAETIDIVLLVHPGGCRLESLLE